MRALVMFEDGRSVAFEESPIPRVLDSAKVWRLHAPVGGSAESHSGLN